MSKLLNSETFGEKLYNSLPEMYRTEDALVDYALRRYLQTLSEGGFAKVVDEINGLTHLLDPERIPAEILPIAFNHYGLEVFNGIPELFLRKLLPMISELYNRKGTITAIEYLTSIISGVKAIVEVDPDFNENYGIDVRLEMNYGDQSKELPERDQLLRIIEEFVPFFCDVTIVYVYLFYELGRMRGTDEAIMEVKEYFAVENGLIISNQTGLSPSLNILNVVLNDSLYLNDIYYYEIEADWYKDVISVIYSEVCNITRQYSKENMVSILNNNRYFLNNTFVLNEFMETDWYEDKISYSAISDVGRTQFTENLVTSLNTHYEELAGISLEKTVDTRHDDVTDLRYESGGLCLEFTKEMKPVLNKDYAKLNVNLVLNQIAEVDEIVDIPRYIPMVDTVSISKEDGSEKYHIEQPNSMLWILNGDKLLNDDFILGEYALSDIGNLKTSENAYSSMFNTIEDSATVSEPPMDTFLNLSHNTLNSKFYLNGLICLDKITVGGVVSYLAPLETGNIIL